MLEKRRTEDCFKLMARGGGLVRLLETPVSLLLRWKPAP
jgi:hypothetical protein